MTFPLASRIALRRFAVYWYVRHGAPVTVTDVNNDPVYAYVQARSGRPSTVIPVMWLFDVVIVQDLPCLIEDLRRVAGAVVRDADSSPTPQVLQSRQMMA